MNDDRWPVVIGLGTITQCEGTLDAPALLAAAAVEAVADAGGVATRPVPAPDLVLVPRGMWKHPDPGRAAAIAAGASKVRSVIAEIGVLQQTLLARAFTAVHTGEAEVAVVAGAEGRYGSLHGVVEAPGEGEPDEILRPAAEIITAVEVQRGLGVPAHQYALMESMIAHAAGRSPAQQAAAVAELWSLGAAAAAGQPGAWRTDAPDAASIDSGEGGNRMIAAPYRKWMVSDWNVDQAVALLITSVGAARRLGIGEQRWVVPAAAAESNHMVPLSARAEPGRCAPMTAVADALVRAGDTVDDVDLVELYSCFPSAVQLQAEALGLDPFAGWTVAGGMTFAGGPLNNYVLQSTAAVIRGLRSAGAGRRALVTSVSGMLTKVGAVVWRAGAPAPGSDPSSLDIDVTAEAARRAPSVPVDADLSGRATVIGQTVTFGRDEQPAQAIVIAEADGVRTVATSDDPAVMADLMVADRVGSLMTVEDGRFTLGG